MLTRLVVIISQYSWPLQNVGVEFWPLHIQKSVNNFMAGPLYLQFHICGFSQLGEKISRKFQKAKLEFSACCNYLHNIHIVLGIINNLKMVESI